MESRISEILDRMNEENNKLKKLKGNYLDCQIARKANEIEISASVYPRRADESVKRMAIKLDGDIKRSVIELVETHISQLGNQCKKNLEDMVEEMKTPH